MPIVAISRGSYRRGKQVAEKLAQRLGYTCIDRDLLIDALDFFHLPEIKMVRNITDATHVLDRFPHGKERYIAQIRSAVLQHCQRDNMVYHGLAGHFFVKDVSHVLKVRIIADLQDRVGEEMEREGISAAEARYILRKDDEERRKWALYLYGIDIWDMEQYDMVLNISAMTVNDAVDILSSTVQLPCFQTTLDSKKHIDDLALSAKVQAELIDFPTATVTAAAGRVFVSLKVPVAQQETIDANIKEIVERVEGVTSVEVYLHPFF